MRGSQYQLFPYYHPIKYRKEEASGVGENLLVTGRCPGGDFGNLNTPGEGTEGANWILTGSHVCEGF